MTTNPFENALEQLARATAVKPFSDDFLARLRSPEREIHVAIPVQMDNGSTQIFEGYRIQYSSARGPYKGGIRYHQDTNSAEVRALAFWMTMKTAVAGIPMGGGKGGVTVNPRELSPAEIERLSRGWVRMLAPVLGPHMDVPAPDVNTTPEIMAWMADEYAKISGDTTNATFTGKPITHGGSEGRSVATGLGGFYVLTALHASLGLPSKMRIAIQGMGNVGGNAARILAEHGHSIIAMSDSKGGVFKEEGLDPAHIEHYKKEHGSLVGYPDAQQISNAELLELPCDVLIPAAMENQITEENASRIHAKVILELANGPTTPAADDILFSRGITVIPDILANAGGVVVSTFEWEQNNRGEHWGEDDVLSKLKTLLETEAGTVFSRAQALSTDMRRSAFIIALERIEQGMRQKGR